MASVDQNTRQQIEQLVAEYRDAWNNHNAAGIAACYTEDGIGVTTAPKVVKNGRQEIEDSYHQQTFATYPHHDSATVDQIIPLGVEVVMAVGQTHLTDISGNKIDGHWTAVFVPEGGKLKIKMITAFTNPPPAQSTG